MKQILSIGFALILATLPLQAQQQESELEKGFYLLQQGSRLLLQGLIQEFGPVLLELEEKLLDLRLYHSPEFLPNGDIIIRRRFLVEQENDGETEL